VAEEAALTGIAKGLSFGVILGLKLSKEKQTTDKKTNTAIVKKKPYCSIFHV